MRLAVIVVSASLILVGCGGSPVTSSVSDTKAQPIHAASVSVPESVKEAVRAKLSTYGYQASDFLNVQPGSQAGLYTFHANLDLGSGGGYVNSRDFYGNVRDGQVTIEINRVTRHRPNPGNWGADV